MTSLIQTLTRAKKNFIAPQRMSFEERERFVAELSSRLKFRNPLKYKQPPVGLPTGVIVALIPEVQSQKYLEEFLPPALLAGNSVILASQKELSWTQDLSEFFNDGLIQTATFQTPDELEILSSHPAVNAFYGSGSTQLFLNLMKNELFQVKKHFYRGSSSNSFLILADANLQSAFENFWNSVILENGLHPTSTKKLLLLESHLPDFKSWLAQKVNEPMSHSTTGTEEKLIQQIQQESGKILTKGSPTLVLDLPHCSELQQIEINLPIGLISTVK